jgi:hypothetical protein
LQGLGTLGIDFNRTHATNPGWTGHARFHVVWQSTSVALLSVVELLLIWLGPFQHGGFYLASLLAAVSPLGFLTAFVYRGTFGGTLSDANGIPPARLKIFGAIHSVDLNLVAVVVALISLVAINAIYKA